MRDDDLLLSIPNPEFGSGVIGVCDVCRKRQAVIVLEKERFQLCVIDFLNKTWTGVKSAPGAPLPPYRSERLWYPTAETRSGEAATVVLSPTKVVKHPIVLITPEVYGLTTTLLDAAIRCARAGCEVLLPDLQKSGAVGPSHHVTMRRGVATGAGVPLDHSKIRALTRLYLDGLAFLRTREMVDPEKVAIFGAGYGGALAASVAAQDPNVTALVVAYPTKVSPPESLRLVSAPVLFLGAGRDKNSVQSLRQYQEYLGTRGGRVDVLVAPDAKSPFLARDSKAYRLADAEAAWSRMDGFLRERLLPPPPKPAPPPPTAATPAPAIPPKAPTPAAAT
jgi:dienelactone hydrolase